MSKGPLDGIKVLDCTHILSGAFSSMLLGDLGAEVIKVERIGTGDPVRLSGPPFQNGEGAYFISVNRNKKSICVDLKKPAGIEIIHKLVSQSDVFMENFRPGVMDRLGLGYDALTKINPNLIYASLTAFGRNGPFKHKPGFELARWSFSRLTRKRRRLSCTANPAAAWKRMRPNSSPQGDSQNRSSPLWQASSWRICRRGRHLATPGPLLKADWENHHPKSGLLGKPLCKSPSEWMIFLA